MSSDPTRPRPRLRTRASGGRLAVSLVALALLLVALAGCGGDGSSADAGDAPAVDSVGAEPLAPVADHPDQTLPATVTSDDGTEVTVTDTSRILPLWGNLNEMVFALGLGENVVGRDVAAQFPGTEDLPVVTNGHDVSAEAALSLEPTVVFAQDDTGPPEALEQIRAAGVPVVVVDSPGSLDDIWPRIRVVAAALGVPEAGEALVDRTEAQIAQAQEAIPEGDRPRVAFLYLRGSAGVYLLGGPGSGADSMIDAAGGADAGTDIGLDRSFTPLTSEAMVTAAPDVLLLTDSGLDSVGGIDALLAMPGIAQTPAARDRRVVTVDDGVLYSFGSRTPQAIAELVEKLHGQ
ncbi:MAG TPA: ABC transporter substrate-binding protein [Acidimicrobiales bacterium]